MLYAFTIALREAVEVGLILSMIIAYLRKLGRKELVNYAYCGAALGVLSSIALAAGLFTIYNPETAISVGGPASAGAFFVALLVLAFIMRRYMKLGFAPLAMVSVAVALMFLGLYGYSQTRVPEMLEVGALFSAVMILTYVIRWMAKVAYSLKEKITSKIDLSVTKGKVLSILTLTIAAVLREGAEASLLLTSAMLVSPGDTVVGALLGVAVASALSYVYITRSVKLNWRKFFLFTSIFLIIFCSGILKVGLQDTVELGFLPPVIERVYDASVVLPEASVVGGLLYVFVGYTETSSLLPLVVQLFYLFFALKMIADVYHVSIPRLLAVRTVDAPLRTH